MAIHHNILCTSLLWSATLRVPQSRALHLECSYATYNKFITTQKLGVASTPSRHHKKHDKNIPIGPKGEDKNKGRELMHPSAPCPTSSGSSGSAHHHKFPSPPPIMPKGDGKNKGRQPMHPSAPHPHPTSNGSSGSGHHHKFPPPPRPIMPIYHLTNIDSHLWEYHSVLGDIIGSLDATPDILLKKQLYVDPQVKAGNDFDPTGSSSNNLGEGPKDVPKEVPRPKNCGGYEVPRTRHPPDGQKPKETIYMTKVMGKVVPEWFTLEMLHELTKCWPHWKKNVRWTVMDLSRRMSKDTVDEVDSGLDKMKLVEQASPTEEELDSEREKIKVAQQMRQIEETRNMQFEEEVEQLRAKQIRTLDIVLKLQPDMVVLHHMVAPRSPPHPPSPHSNSAAKPPIKPPHQI